MRRFTHEIILSAFSSKILSPGWEGSSSLCILQLAVNLESLFLEFLLKFSGNIQKSKDSKLFTYFIHLILLSKSDSFLCVWAGFLVACFSYSCQCQRPALSCGSDTQGRGGSEWWHPWLRQSCDPEAWDSASLQAALLCGSFRVRLTCVNPFKHKA